MNHFINHKKKEEREEGKKGEKSPYVSCKKEKKKSTWPGFLLFLHGRG